MKTKKIVADTMPLALKKVRQELGDNAIIVNTKAIKTGGIFGLFAKQKFEVTAYSIDKAPAPAAQPISFETKVELRKRMHEKKQSEPSSVQGGKQDSVFHKSPQKLYNFYSQSGTEPEKTERKAPAREQIQSSSEVTRAPVNASDPQLLEELQNMRKMMMTFMMNNEEGQVLPANLSQSIKRLKNHGVNEETIEYILSCLFKKHEAITDLDEAAVKKELRTIIQEIIKKRVPPSKVVSESTRMINVIGPTGVGKTTSIAKLATEQVLKQKRRVAMITADVYRIAAVEQLKTYAGILNVPIEVVRSTDELEVALQKLKSYDLIYMDTTGRNYKEIKHRESIAEFLNHPLKSENYLVLSLTTKFEDMEILLDEFLKSPVKKLILTKFDETTSIGSILNIAFKYPYQLAYITNGQSVPEDITDIDAVMLAGYLLGEEK